MRPSRKFYVCATLCLIAGYWINPAEGLPEVIGMTLVGIAGALALAGAVQAKIEQQEDARQMAEIKEKFQAIRRDYQKQFEDSLRKRRPNHYWAMEALPSERWSYLSSYELGRINYLLGERPRIDWNRPHAEQPVVISPSVYAALRDILKDLPEVPPPTPIGYYYGCPVIVSQS